MTGIEIHTTQNVTIEYELATLQKRFGAFLIDLFAYYVIYSALLLVTLYLMRGNITEWGAYFLLLASFFGLLAYHLLFEIFGNGQSLGKRLAKIKVVRLDGREPEPGDYLIRCIFLLADFFLSAGALGGILIGSTDKGQRLGDLAANTTVIRTKSSRHFRLEEILKINTLENYEPQYPEVRQLSEADMLLVKSLLSRYQAWYNSAHTEAIEEAVQHICWRLDIQPPAGSQIDFLKTLVRDYIVLTR